MGEQRLLVVLGNQLFPPERLKGCRDAVVFMAEDIGLCTYVKHHQQKIVLFLAAMRSYADELRATGFEVRYFSMDADDDSSYEDKLDRVVAELDCRELLHFEVEDKPMEGRLIDFCEQRSLARVELRSPMFYGTRDDFGRFADGRSRLLMADYYKLRRQQSGILLDADGRPEGGKWSYDESNRRKLPKDVQPPDIAAAPRTRHVEEVIGIVERNFADHPGRADDFWWPTTREQARAWLRNFLDERLAQFGPYEDAISKRSETVFHSALSPSLNLGLLTPDEVVDAVLERYETHDLPIESIEGFIRQVIGWREFVRGVYQVFGDDQESRNFWNHERELADDWYC
ncbi:MAG: cryptochrome/photolyase family protein, partial [Gammaproteobacteria bacterium]|nr:cryptochrome/photolyase family protein [Gammaproteobacteria bacterium]